MNSMHNRPSRVVSRAVVVSFVCGALLFQGCNTCTRTRLLSTLGGAALGAGIGYAGGGNEGLAIGALAGTAAGFLVGELICVEQRRLEAQKAASKARVEQAQSVLKKYRAYNKDLEEYVKNARTAVTEINSGRLTGEQLAAAKQKTIEDTKKAQDGGRESVEAIREFRVRVEAAKVSVADEQKLQKLLQEEKDLELEEQRLLAQIEEIGQLRGQLGGG